MRRSVEPQSYFNPHSPCGERLVERHRFSAILIISIHTPLAGSDPSDLMASASTSLFQSTLPLRGATDAPRTDPRDSRISIHTPLAGSDALAQVLLPAGVSFQSTLPLRGATFVSRCLRVVSDISIHTPLAGSDDNSKKTAKPSLTFQSTLPLRGATSSSNSCSVRFDYFNPHSPCGERLVGGGGWRDHRLISIHTPLAGSDAACLRFVTGKLFQSTLPLRGATAEMRHF